MLIYNANVLAMYEAVDMEDSGDNSVYVGESGFIGSERSDAIYGYSSNLSAYIAGTVVGVGHGIYFGSDDLDATGENVRIFESGSVFSPNEGIAIYGNQSKVSNAGKIDCDHYSAVVISSGSSSGVSVVTNSGKISAGSVGAGVYFEGAEDGRLVNYGTISGGNSAFHSVHSSGDMTVINKGTMLNSVLFGSGNDIYNGAAGKVIGGVIAGGAGNDKLTGGKASDAFLFATGDDKDTIFGFKTNGRSHDVLDFSGWTAVEDFGSVRDHASQHGNDLWISGGGGDVLILDHVRLRDLTAADFIF